MLTAIPKKRKIFKKWKVWHWFGAIFVILSVLDKTLAGKISNLKIFLKIWIWEKLNYLQYTKEQVRRLCYHWLPPKFWSSH